MVSRLYKLDYTGGNFISTLMGEYPNQDSAEFAKKRFQKEHAASWMISSGEPHARTDGSAVAVAAL